MEPLIRQSDLVSLKNLVLAKVRHAAQDESLLKCPKLPEVLSFWKELAGAAEPITWIKTVIGDDHKIANLLAGFLEKDCHHSRLTVGGALRYHLNHKLLEPFLDLSTVLDRTRTLAESDWLSPPQKDGLRQFIKQYEDKGR